MSVYVTSITLPAGGFKNYEGKKSSLATRYSKICGVCGDRARCYHFGGLCCASCKAFFRRAVIGDEYKPYRCVFGGNCPIDIISRKQCSHCRLKKCLSIGMSKRWFMSEESKAEMKRKSAERLRQKREQQRSPQSNQYTESLEVINRFQKSDYQISTTPYLTNYHLAEIQSIKQLTYGMFLKDSFPDSVCFKSCHKSAVTVAIIFSNVIKRVCRFLMNIPQIKQLETDVCQWLLKRRVMGAIVVVGSLTFDKRERGWVQEGKNLIGEQNHVHVCPLDFECLHGAEVTQKHLDFLCDFIDSQTDEIIIVLSALIVVFTHRDPEALSFLGSTRLSTIKNIQGHFIDLLRRYLHWKLGPVNSENAFSMLALKLPNVREVSHMYQVSKLRLSEDEIRELEDRMDGLTLILNNQ